VDKPTVPGWYWYKYQLKPWENIVLVDRTNSGRLYVSRPDGPIHWLDVEDDWLADITAWSGPIEPPKG